MLGMQQQSLMRVRADRFASDGDKDGADAALYAADRAHKQCKSEDAMLDAMEAAEAQYDAQKQPGSVLPHPPYSIWGIHTTHQRGGTTTDLSSAMCKTCTMPVSLELACYYALVHTIVSSFCKSGSWAAKLSVRASGLHVGLP